MNIFKTESKLQTVSLTKQAIISENKKTPKLNKIEEVQEWKRRYLAKTRGECLTSLHRSGICCLSEKIRSSQNKQMQIEGTSLRNEVDLLPLACDDVRCVLHSRGPDNRLASWPFRFMPNCVFLVWTSNVPNSMNE